MNVRVQCTAMLGPAHQNERLKMSKMYPQTRDNSASGFIVLCAARSSFVPVPEGEPGLSARLIVHNSEPSCSGLNVRAPPPSCGVAARTALAVFLRWSVRVSGGTLDVLAEFRGFPQPLRVNSGIVS